MTSDSKGKPQVSSLLWVSCGEGPRAWQSLGPRGVRAERRAQPFLGLSHLGCALQVAAEEEMLGCGRNVGVRSGPFKACRQ